MSRNDYNIIKQTVSNARKQTLKKVALIIAKQVYSTGVNLKPEESDFAWHADITEWPKTKDEIKLIALELARLAKIESDS